MNQIAERDARRLGEVVPGAMAEESNLGELEELDARLMRWEPRLGMTVGQAEAEAAGVLVGDTLVRIVPMEGGRTSFEDEVVTGGIWHAVGAHNQARSLPGSRPATASRPQSRSSLGQAMRRGQRPGSATTPGDEFAHRLMALTAQVGRLRGNVDFGSGVPVRDPGKGLSNGGSASVGMISRLQELLGRERDYFDWFQCYRRRWSRCNKRARARLDREQLEWNSPAGMARRNAYRPEARDRLTGKHSADVKRMTHSLKDTSFRAIGRVREEDERRQMLTEDIAVQLRQLNHTRTGTIDGRPTSAEVAATRAAQLRGSAAITALPLSREALIAVGPPAETDSSA